MGKCCPIKCTSSLYNRKKTLSCSWHCNWGVNHPKQKCGIQKGSTPKVNTPEWGKMTAFSLCYLLTPCSRVLFDKLTSSQLVMKFPTFYGTWKVYYCTQKCPTPVPNLSLINSVHAPLNHLPEDPSGTESHVPFPLLRPYPRLCPGLRHMYWFCNKASFYSEELLAPRPTPKLEDHPLSAVHDFLFNIFAAILHTWGPSSIHSSGCAMPWWQELSDNQNVHYHRT